MSELRSFGFHAFILPPSLLRVVSAMLSRWIDLHIRTMAQGRGDLLGPQSLDPRDIGAGVVGQPAGEFAAGRIVQRHDVPLLKVAARLDDADRQQAAALLLDRPAGAGVDGQPAAGLGGKADPALPRAESPAPGRRTACRPVRRPAIRARLPGCAAAGDDHVFAGRWWPCARLRSCWPCPPCSGRSPGRGPAPGSMRRAA